MPARKGSSPVALGNTGLWSVCVTTLSVTAVQTARVAQTKLMTSVKVSYTYTRYYSLAVLRRAILITPGVHVCCIIGRPIAPYLEETTPEKTCKPMPPFSVPALYKAGSVLTGRIVYDRCGSSMTDESVTDDRLHTWSIDSVTVLPWFPSRPKVSSLINRPFWR